MYSAYFRFLNSCNSFQILVFLHFVGTNSFYHVVRDSQGPSPQTVGRIVRRVASALFDLKNEIICWPDNPESLRQQFYQFGHFPSVAGCLDGSHVLVRPPKNDEASFLNRHHQHSINLLGVCGPNFEFLYLNANSGGRRHDAKVLRTSSLWRKFEQGDLPFQGALLLGDSAYPLRSWLMTPILGAQDRASQRYNSAHAKTRNLIERSFAILKNRFHILQSGIRFHSMNLASKIIICCGILHNLAIRHGDTYDDEEDDTEPNQNPRAPELDNDLGDPMEDQNGRLRRNRLLIQFSRP